MTSLKDTWKLLEQDFQNSLILRDVEIPNISFFDISLSAGLTTDQTRFVLITTECLGEQPLKLPQFIGFSTELTEKPFEGGISLEIRLSRDEFHEIFDLLIQNVRETIGISSDSRDAVNRIFTRFEIWQEFLSKVSLSGMNEQRQRGLFGELYLLRQHLIPALGVEDAIRSWVGPANAHQDYQFPQYALETKTTKTLRPQTITISSELQLDIGNKKGLFLVHLSFDEGQSSGENLNDMINSLQEIIGAGLQRAQFDEMLFRSGYSAEHSKHYDTPYELRVMSCFQVTPEFPRIEEGDLPKGVGRVSYALSLDACAEYEISSETMIATVREGLAGNG
tara:strand:- start:34 stop:1041 length:1008 start_codon:yes stop_codon:yes gene_type:complete